MLISYQAMGFSTKRLIDSLTPVCITTSEAVTEKIMWLARETTDGLSREENRFVNLFNRYLARPGHPNHPNVIERTTPEQREAAEAIPAFRARSFIREVTGTNLLSNINVGRFILSY